MRLIYTLLLVLVTAVWGWTFVVVQDATIYPHIRPANTNNPKERHQRHQRFDCVSDCLCWPKGAPMTKRRTKGEGTIYRRKSDGRWVGMYTVNTLDGVKRRAVYGKSKKEVRLRLTEAIADRDKGLAFDSGNLSVGEYLGRWLEAIQSTIGELTWKRHESIVRLHIAPAIGAIKLAALTPLQVQSLYRAKSKSHLGHPEASSASIRRYTSRSGKP